MRSIVGDITTVYRRSVYRRSVYRRSDMLYTRSAFHTSHRSVLSVPSTFFAFSLLCFVLISPLHAWAQAGSSSSRLFSRDAMRKADARGVVRGVGLSSTNGISSNAILIDSLQLESVEEILQEDELKSSFLRTYRGYAYLSYLNDFFEVGELEELEQGSFAERVFLFHGMKTIGESLKGTPVDLAMKSMMRKLKKVKDHTTLHVDRDYSGRFNIKKKSKDSPLFEFKLHASANAGIEPRIKFRDHLTLRHDLLGDATWLEYRLDF